MKSLFPARAAFILACFSLFFHTPLSAQFDLEKKLEQYAKKGEKKIERRVDSEVDKKMEEGVDEVFKKKKKKKKGEASAEEPATPKYFKLEETADISQNDFIGSFVMNVSYGSSTEDSLGKSEIRNFYFDPARTAVRYVTPSGELHTLIYNLENFTMTQLSDGPSGKVAVLMRKPPSMRLAVDSQSIKIDPLPATKTIEGQLCTKFKVETPDDFITLWVCCGLEYNFDMMMRSSNTHQTSNERLLKASSSYGILGIPMEMVFESRLGNEIVHMRLVNFQPGPPDQQVFDISGANLIDMTNY